MGRRIKGQNRNQITFRKTISLFELQILSRIVHEAGGHNAYIEVITSASSIPEEIGQKLP
ncbi:MAG: hypothetical protein U0X76_04020 [Bacteroidia bacterium]